MPGQERVKVVNGSPDVAAGLRGPPSDFHTTSLLRNLHSTLYQVQPTDTLDGKMVIIW